MIRQKSLNFFTTGYSQAAIIFPIVVVSPAYFAGAIQLGGLVQISTAFTSVQTALSFFVTTYRDLAEWRAVIARLDGFNRSIEAASSRAQEGPKVDVNDAPSKTAIAVVGLRLEKPARTPLLSCEDVALLQGQRILVTGPTGAGKSTFLRAIAGIWPFGTGNIVVTRGVRLMLLPQRPYFPISSLEEAVSYPLEQGAFTAERINEVLQAVGLSTLVGRLSEEAHWNRILSLGEQQRLAIARAILQAPDCLFLDEATASLDEPSEAKLYKMLQERMPRATIVSIAHRSTLFEFHDRRLNLQPDGERHRIREVALLQEAGG
jgi:putative ATP-binding cassette transporter